MKKTGNTILRGVKLLSLALAMVIAFTAVSPITVAAKTKTLNLKKAPKYYGTVAEADAVATTVEKTGSYKIKLNATNKKKGLFEGYVKFTAPTTKTYTITVSGASHPGHGFFTAKQPSSYDPESLDYVYYKKNISFNFAYKTYTSKNKYKGKTYSTKYKKKQSMKVELQAGQSVYVDVFLASSKKKSQTLNLSIK